MRISRPRRCSKRWLDGDCPKGVLAVFDNKGQTADRYTVIYAEVYKADYEGATPYLWGRCMSESPSHPQGIGISVEWKLHEAAAYRYRNKHRYTKWSALPEPVKTCILRDLTPEQPLETAA